MSSYPGDQRWAAEQHAKLVNELADADRKAAMPCPACAEKDAEIERVERLRTGSIVLSREVERLLRSELEAAEARATAAEQERDQAIINCNEKIRVALAAINVDPDRPSPVRDGVIDALWRQRAEAAEQREAELRVVNINRRVRVTLTSAGRARLQDHLDTLCAVVDGHDIDLTDKRRDVNGPTEWQLWELFEVFGPKMGMGMPRPFFDQNNIEVPTDALASPSTPSPAPSPAAVPATCMTCVHLHQGGALCPVRNALVEEDGRRYGARPYEPGDTWQMPGYTETSCSMHAISPSAAEEPKEPV